VVVAKAPSANARREKLEFVMLTACNLNTARRIFRSCWLVYADCQALSRLIGDLAMNCAAYCCAASTRAAAGAK
jgi:hypothetical protein